MNPPMPLVTQKACQIWWWGHSYWGMYQAGGGLSIALCQQHHERSKIHQNCSQCILWDLGWPNSHSIWHCLPTQPRSKAHTAQLTHRWLQAHQVNVLPWLSGSPNLNIIEHVWAHLKQRVGLHKPAPWNKEELWAVTKEEWNSISPEFIASLYDSMPHKKLSVYSAKGGNPTTNVSFGFLCLVSHICYMFWPKYRHPTCGQK
jgi:hypothetical protein